jgi:hypothetical protein
VDDCMGKYNNIIKNILGEDHDIYAISSIQALKNIHGGILHNREQKERIYEEAGIKKLQEILFSLIIR